MAAQEEYSGLMAGVRDLLGSIVDAYRYMDMPVDRYVLVVLLPGVLVSLVVGAGIVILSPPLLLALPIALFGLLAPVIAFVYPKIAIDRKRREVREQFHLFLTHITVLSTTNIDRIEIFRTLARVEEYGVLAEEMGRVTALVDTWNQSLDDACRRRSKRVSSELLADFFERLSYTVGAGQPIETFLIDEQESIIQEFVIRYESALSTLDVLKELYLSMMLSISFILVFTTVLPLLTGTPPTLLVGGSIVMFLLVQVGFLVAIHTVSPRDPVWLTPEDDRSPMYRVVPWLVLGVVLSLLAMGGVVAIGLGYAPVSLDVLPRPIYLAIPVTPLLIPGLVMRSEEQKVNERDNGFPSFIRALGSVESVKQTSTANVLESLRTKDFGALTGNIDNLYKRLRVRIDTAEAWRLFSAETGSYLIHKFGNMYVAGRRMGGSPKQLGQVISTNFNEVMQVREQRQQATTTFIGVVYGMTAAMIFASFIGLGIAEQMVTITEEITSEEGQFTQSLFASGSYDLALIEFLLLGVVLLNALFSALMIRIIDRGHFVSSFTHYALLIWAGALVATLTQVIIGGIIS
jgi:flagellar protein FlaJ